MALIKPVCNSLGIFSPKKLLPYFSTVSETSRRIILTHTFNYIVYILVPSTCFEMISADDEEELGKNT